MNFEMIFGLLTGFFADWRGLILEPSDRWTGATRGRRPMTALLTLLPFHGVTSPPVMPSWADSDAHSS